MAARDLQWLLEQHLEELRRRHKDNQEWWRALDTKAQGNIVACGILLAGTLARVDVYLGNVSDAAHRLLFLLSVWTLLASMAMSISALLIRRTKTPPAVDIAARNVRQVRDELAQASPPNNTERLFVSFVHDQFSALEECVADDVNAALQKASRIKWSQLILLGAGGSIALLVTLKALTQPSSINEAHQPSSLSIGDAVTLLREAPVQDCDCKAPTGSVDEGGTPALPSTEQQSSNEVK